MRLGRHKAIPAENTSAAADVHTLEPIQREYLSATMERVSRSFALVVPCLEAPLQHYFATAYLLCRALDNIEDCARGLDWQKQRFAEFHQLLWEPRAAAEQLSVWEADEWPGLSEEEWALMTADGGGSLWSIYESFPARTRGILQNWIPRMAKGMEEVLDPAQSPPVVVRRGVRVLSTAAAYNDYCYTVAGTVGAMGTELVIDHYGLSKGLARTLLAGSEACGRALQKTNVLKDFAEDLQRQVCYLPDEWLREIDYAPLVLGGAPVDWTARVLDDILTELRSATAYVLDVPHRAADYRVASLMCLLPAYETIRSAALQRRELFTAGHQIKIARPTMARCVAEAVSLATDDDAIVRYSSDLESQIRDALSSREQAS
ncbi:MAG: squalene/phytoene synthase family protein [Mycobacterium sp.]|nr:squalene/phytoene synthase family protein [Mycobacterium sp.]